MLRFFKWPIILIVTWWLGWQSHYYWSSLPNIISTPVGNTVQNIQNGSVPPSVTTQRAFTPSMSEKDDGWQIGTMLTIHEYESVIEMLLDDQLKEHQASMKHAIVEHLRLLLAKGDYVHADELFSLYLEVEYRDVATLLLRADSYRAQQQLGLAIETLYKARAYEYRGPQIARLIDKIRSWVEQFDKKSRDLGDNQARLALFEQLTTLEPDYSPYFVELARVQASLGNINEARQSLSLVEYDSRVSNEVTQLLNQLENDLTVSSEQPAAIPLIRRGDHFLVQAWLNDDTAIHLLIDTGASLTMIRSDVLRAAGISRMADQPVRRFNTANGMVHASIFVLDTLSMGEQRVGNLEVGTLSEENFQAADGLLGMNFLKHFKFFIDQGEQVLRLTPLS